MDGGCCLIDADLRSTAPAHDRLGTSFDPGLSDYLLGESDEFSIMQRGPMENLFFIPGGTRARHDPAELVANGRLKNAAAASRDSVRLDHDGFAAGRAGFRREPSWPNTAMAC